MVLNLLGKGIRQAGKTAHRHPHREILPLHVTGGNMLGVWIAADHFQVASDATGWRILAFRLHRSTIDFLQRSEIDIRAKGTFNSLQVSAVSVCSDLNAAIDTAG